MYEMTAEWWNAAPSGTRRADMTLAELKDECGCANRDVMRHRRKRARQRVAGVEWADLTAREATPDVVVPIEERVERDSFVERLQSENRDLRAKYNLALRTKNIHGDIRDVAWAVMRAIPPVVVEPPHIGHGTNREDAILAWADWHGGERIDYDIMQGMNAYNPEIMCRRAQVTVDKTLSLLFENHSGTTFETLYVFDLGDGVNGDLLDSAKATNALGVFEAMLLVARVKATALVELSAHIPVVFVAVPGNHGRRAPKMDWKQPTETADWLVAEMIAALCKDNSRVTCHVPKAWTCAVEIRGYTHSLNHGYAAARGGYGGIPFYALQKADGLQTAMEVAQGQTVDFRWRGHIHTPATLPKMDGIGDQFMVGSLCGGGEYAKEELNRYGAPSQKLVGCHETTGVSFEYKVAVQGSDDEPSRYEVLLP